MDTEAALILANTAAYASLAVGLVVRRRSGMPRDMDSVALFGLLESSLERKFPDLPPGFTWREGLAMAQRLRLDLDWSAIDAAAERYEAFRYGGAPPEPPQPELVKLVRSLRG